MPFTLLRRLDCVLEPTNKAVIAEHAKRKDSGIKDLAPFLLKKSGQSFYNTSRFSLPTLLDDSKHIRQNLLSYLADYSIDARDIFERFKFAERITLAYRPRRHTAATIGSGTQGLVAIASCRL